MKQLNAFIYNVLIYSNTSYENNYYIVLVPIIL